MSEKKITITKREYEAMKNCLNCSKPCYEREYHGGHCPEWKLEIDEIVSYEEL